VQRGALSRHACVIRRSLSSVISLTFSDPKLPASAPVTAARYTPNAARTPLGHSSPGLCPPCGCSGAPSRPWRPLPPSYVLEDPVIGHRSPEPQCMSFVVDQIAPFADAARLECKYYRVTFVCSTMTVVAKRQGEAEE
jgi:hypothetical protein